MLHVYPANVEAGEDVRILRREVALREGLLPGPDYWLFDDYTAAELAYDDAGYVKDVILWRDQAFVQTFEWNRNAALRLSTPLAEYVRLNHITEKEHAA